MTDLDKTKQHFLDIGLHFSSCQTLNGFMIYIYSNDFETQFNFDKDGKFEKIKTIEL